MLIRFLPNTDITKMRIATSATTGNKAVFIEGTLEITTSDGKVHNFKANSGGGGKGTAPHGIYTINSCDKLPDTTANDAYKKTLYPWFALLNPLFRTERTGLGIHADGNVLGTLGCLGITENDSAAYDLIKAAVLKKEVIKVYVF